MMSSEINTIKNILNKAYPKFYVNSVLDLGDYYVVNLQKNGLNADEFVLDSLYKVDKKTKKVSSFTPAENRKAYLNALKNPLYLKNRDESKMELKHYGTPRHSGRYPWGSGKRPKQRLERSKNEDDDFIVSGSRVVSGARSTVSKEKKQKESEKSPVKKKTDAIKEDTAYRKALAENQRIRNPKLSPDNLTTAATKFKDASKYMVDVSNGVSSAWNDLHNAKYRNKDRSKKVKDLSNAELQNVIARIKLEQEYNRITMPQKRSGYDKTMAALSVIGTAATVTATGLSIAAGVKALRRQ